MAPAVSPISCCLLAVLLALASTVTRPADAAQAPHAAGAAARGDSPSRRAFVETQAAEAGLRKLSGKHLKLFTDVPSAADIDVLPEVFDQAFPQWCAYFGLEAGAQAGWRITGFLMKDGERFRRLGLLPADLPPFPHGYSRREELWLYDQPSDYYRRHLLLHEGVHSFMDMLLGGCGPPWYMEGTAELLSTHRWRDGRLTVNVIPANREEVPLWGRIKIVTDGFAEHRAKTLRQVIELDGRAHRETEPYGWCWAAAVLLDHHPRYQHRFRQLARLVRSPDLSAQFYRLIDDDWDGLAEEWEVFVATLEYGHDIPRTAIDFAPGRPLAPEGQRITVAADRGWQNTGVLLEGGAAYRLRARGRYQVADRPQVWWCEPNGVSIRYYRGQPLGILQAAVHPHRPAGGPSPLVQPIAIGLDHTLTPKHGGTLMLKINDSPAELADNAGSLEVHVSRAAEREG